MKVNIIGLGEIGSETLRKMKFANKPFYDHNRKYNGLNYTYYGTDIDKSKAEFCKSLGVKFSTKPVKGCDVYIICVWTTDQIMEVTQHILKLNSKKHKCIISIESTIDPSKINHLQELTLDYHNVSLASFPHRYNPNDLSHSIFNQDRVLGVWPSKDIPIVCGFYSPFMEFAQIHTTTFELASLSKVVENAYRYMEIVIAQELSDVLGKERFEAVRRLSNTKWNIDIKEAKDGVKGKCLPKDMELLFEYAPVINGLLNKMIICNYDFIQENS